MTLGCRRLVTSILSLAVAAALGLPLRPATASAAPRLQAVRVSRSPVIDGRLDDAVWKRAKPSHTFIQKSPAEGKPVSERTVLRVLYDSEALYIGFECSQRQVPVIARLTRRDRDIESDWVSVSIDSRRTGTTAFEFAVNAAGVQRDGLFFDDTEYSRDWDENWSGRVAVGPQGWSAEMRIPFRVLRFDVTVRSQAWGFQARRYISARQETSEWSFIPRKGAGEVSRYGRLENLVDLRAGSPIEIRPFVLGKILRRDATADTLGSGVDATGSAGLDLKWHLTQNLTLDVALNPDFGQVEADQVVFNLTNVEVYLPEKRAFFLEGIETFATVGQLFYSRRIGRVAPSPSLRDSPAEALVDLPQPATIYAASKLVGQLGRRWRLGVLTAVSGANDVMVQGPDGRREERRVEPLTLYNVLRLKLALGGNSHLGLMATATNRFEALHTYPVQPSGARFCSTGEEVSAGSRCLHDAYVAGIDGRWRSPGGDYTLVGQTVLTLMHQGPPRTLPDGTVLGSGDVGLGGYMAAAKQGGLPWLWGFSTGIFDRKLEFNDLGYLERQSIWGAEGYLEYRTLGHSPLETRTRLDIYHWRNLSHLLIFDGINLGTTIRFANFWTLFGQAHFRPTWFDDREVGDGTTLQHEGLVGFDLKVTSDPRRLVHVDMGVTFQQRFNAAGSYLRAAGTLTFRIVPRLDLDLLPEVLYSFGEPRFVGEGAPGQYIFGRLLGRSVGVTLRATYTFLPRLTLQVYTQLLIASRHFSSFSSLASDPAGARPVVHLRDLQPAPAPFDNPDSVEGALNVNVVLRWEYLLGSTLFVIYRRTQVPNLSLAPGQAGGLDLGALGRGPAVDQFLVKIGYWWG